jgi:hypothetical protein
MNTCFSDISGGLIKYLSISELQNIKTAWNTFREVEIYNSNISTLRNTAVQTGNDPRVYSYYQFQSDTEKQFYNKGLSDHFRLIGFSNTVNKN